MLLNASGYTFKKVREILRQNNVLPQNFSVKITAHGYVVLALVNGGTGLRGSFGSRRSAEPGPLSDAFNSTVWQVQIKHIFNFLNAQ